MILKSNNCFYVVEKGLGGKISYFLFSGKIKRVNILNVAPECLKCSLTLRSERSLQPVCYRFMLRMFSSKSLASSLPPNSFLFIRLLIILRLCDDISRSTHISDRLNSSLVSMHSLYPLELGLRLKLSTTDMKLGMSGRMALSNSFQNVSETVLLPIACLCSSVTMGVEKMASSTFHFLMSFSLYCDSKILASSYSTVIFRGDRGAGSVVPT